MRRPTAPKSRSTVRAQTGSSVPELLDEGRHEPAPDKWWNESWYFDFAAPDGSIGGYVRLGYYPNQQVAWWWAYLGGPDRPLVALRAHDVAGPKQGVEVRPRRLWACPTPGTPPEATSVG